MSSGSEVSKSLYSHTRCSRHHMPASKYSPITDPRQLFRNSPTRDCQGSKKVTHEESWIKGQKHLRSQIQNSISFLGISLLKSLLLPSSGNPQVLTLRPRVQVHSSYHLQTSMTEIFRLRLVNRRPLCYESYMKSKNLTGFKQMNISFSFHGIIKSTFH